MQSILGRLNNLHTFIAEDWRVTTPFVLRKKKFKNQTKEKSIRDNNLYHLDSKDGWFEVSATELP